jgi:transposase-like protein
MRSNSRRSRLVTRARKPRVVRKRSAAEWAKLLALCERSGLSQKRFCRENEVALSTLQYWRRESGRGRREGALVEVPANVSDTESVEHAAPSSPGSVHIRLPNRLELDVLAGTDSAWVSQLLRELLTCSG